jgi:uncharacterized protein YbjQ (UPF0145 family)
MPPPPTPPHGPSNPPHPPGLPDAPGWPIHPAMISTTLEIPGFRVRHLIGVVRGITVRSPGFGGGISAAFQSLGGGNVKALSDLCEQAREEAFFLMVQHAAQMGANAVVGFRYDATEIGQGLSEVLAYGSAAWVDPEGRG